MNEHQIECFLAAAQERSFSRAARKLYMTQPAITHQIAALEKELNVSLFKRGAAGVALTPHGERFLSPAQNLQDAFYLARSSVQEKQEGHRPIVLGCPRAVTMMPATYQLLVTALMELFPECPIRIQENGEELSGKSIYNSLKNGMDCVIGMDLGEEIENRAEIETLFLFQTGCWIAVSAQHPLYPKKSVTEQELGQMHLYYCSSDEIFIRQVRHRLSPSSTAFFHAVENPMTVIPSVRAGDSGFLMPNTHSYFEMDHYIEWKLDVPLPPTHIFYLKKSRDSMSAMLAKEVQRIHQLHTLS